MGRRRGWLWLGVFLLGLALTLTFIWSLPPLYQASATLVVVNPGSGGKGGSPDSFGVGAPPPLDAVTQQVLGRDSLATIIPRFGLLPKGQSGPPTEAQMNGVRKNVAVKKEQTQGSRNTRQTLAFTVSYNNGDPKAAAGVANALAHSYQTTAVRIQTSQAKRKAAALSTNLAVIRKKLATQRTAINQFNTKHLGALPEQQQVSLATLGNLYRQLQTDQSTALSLTNRRTDLIEKMGNSDNSGNATLAQLKQKLRNLRLRYTDQYPEVISVKRQIAALESGQGSHTSASPMQSELNQVNVKLGQLQSHENKLRSQIAGLQSRLSTLPITKQHLQFLNQNSNQTSKVYARLLTQYEQARIIAATAGKGAAPYSITEPALMPKAPLGPKRLRYAVIFIILCAVLAFAIAAFTEKRDTSFHTLEELREYTSVPVLATIPVIRRRRDKAGRLMKAGAVVLVLICGAAILGGIGYAAGHHNHTISQALSVHGS